MRVLPRGEKFEAVVHGYDSTLLGTENELGWCRNMPNKRYDVNIRGRLGPDRGDEKSIRILNRVVSWAPHGIKYEADQRHSDTTVKHMGLVNSTPMSTPGAKWTASDVEKMAQEEVCEDRLTEYRALVARANYISQDRLDTLYAVKELSRDMPCPKATNFRAPKMLVRYRSKNPRHVNTFNYQNATKAIAGYAGTDHAGCWRTRRSTSGGVIRRGEHCIHGVTFHREGDRTLIWRGRVLWGSQRRCRRIGLHTLARGPRHETGRYR